MHGRLNIKYVFSLVLNRRIWLLRFHMNWMLQKTFHLAVADIPSECARASEFLSRTWTTKMSVLAQKIVSSQMCTYCYEVGQRAFYLSTGKVYINSIKSFNNKLTFKLTFSLLNFQSILEKLSSQPRSVLWPWVNCLIKNATLSEVSRSVFGIGQYVAGNVISILIL